MCRKERLIAAAFREVDLFRNHYNLVAIVERGGRILSIGYNDMNKTHPAYFNGEYDRGIHAEYAAIRQAQNPKGANLYVFRFKKSGGLGNSKPCEHCFEQIREAGIKKVFYYEDQKLVKHTL